MSETIEDMLTLTDARRLLGRARAVLRTVAEWDRDEPQSAMTLVVAAHLHRDIVNALSPK
jgi:hypothetical protein